MPGYDGKSAITKYHVKYKTDEKDDWSLSVVPASKTWMVFKNSKNRTYIKVAAKNGIGIGKYSKTVEVIVTKNGKSHTNHRKT